MDYCPVCGQSVDDEDDVQEDKCDMEPVTMPRCVLQFIMRQLQLATMHHGVINPEDFSTPEEIGKYLHSP